MKSNKIRTLRTKGNGWNMFLMCVLVMEFVVFGIANPKFLRIPLLLSSVNDFIAICLISLFVTFVMITGGIDIQAGAIVGLTSIIIGVAWQDFGFNIWGAVVLAVVAAALCGALSDFFIAYCRVIEENNGWPFHLLTEDIQFSVDSAIKGRKIGYCDSAVIYDEQPTTFRQSWDQRLRWSKGFYQVDREYIAPLLKGCFRKGRLGTSCYDMFITVAPGMLLTVALILLNTILLIGFILQPAHISSLVIAGLAGLVLSTFTGFYMIFLLYGLLTVLSEWKHIHAKAIQKIGYVFTFPIFMFTYIPISIVALVKKVEWKPIQHTATKENADLVSSDSM